MPAIRLMLVDDHPLLSQGLKKLLSLEADFLVVGEVQNGMEVIEKASSLNPDVILMDLNLPGKNGIELTAELKVALPQINVLALTVDNEQEHVSSIIKAGALGYLLKDIDPETLFTAIRAVARGEAYIQPCLLAKILAEFRQLLNGDHPSIHPEQFGLTQREHEIITCIATGNSNKEIAEQLFISEKTVKNHVSSILRKMGLEDRTQVAVYAYRQGMVNS